MIAGDNTGIHPIYTVCPNCGRTTATDTTYCRHCKAPLYDAYIDVLTPPIDYNWDISIGVDRNGNQVGFNSADLSRHTVIMGNVGSGKTTLAKKMLLEANKLGINFAVLDIEGEYKDLGYATGARILGGPHSKNPIKINLFDPGEAPIHEYSEHVYSVFVEVIKEDWTDFRPQMSAILRDSCLVAVEKRASIDEFMNIIDYVASNYHQPKVSATALKSRLSNLTKGPISRVFTNDSDSLENVLNERTIIDLSWLSKISLSTVPTMGRLISLKIFYHVLNQPLTNRTRFIFLIDEAERIISTNHPPRFMSSTSQMMFNTRKRGTGIIMAFHSPSLIDQSILRPVGNVAVFNLSHPGDAKIAAGMLGSEHLFSEIQRLGVGEAIVKPAGAINPFYVRVVKTDMERYNSTNMKLLASIRERPYLTQRERRAYLGIDGRTYSRALAELVEEGLIEIVTVYTGRGRPVKLLQIKGMNPGVDHEFLAHRASEIVNEYLGVKSKPSRRGPDIVFGINGRIICIEAETGSNIIRGKYMAYMEKCDVLIILCGSKKCLKRANRIVTSLTLNGVFQVTTLYKLSSVLKRIL
ncbi:MAG: DUF87 domain-containing protein [Desulfurococcales archaeon]|nr:DUF87 domain-containing protein [Desulfurococcales archaeon]